MFKGKVSAATFLRQYWQRKPLLLPQAFPDFRDPITPEELAALPPMPSPDEAGAGSAPEADPFELAQAMLDQNQS